MELGRAVEGWGVLERAVDLARRGEPFVLATVVWLEVMTISLLGTLVGTVGALPVVLAFHLNPIRLGDEMADMMEEYGMEAVIKSSIDPSIFIQQALVVAAIATAVSVYPFIKLMGLNAIKAMRS